MVSAILVKEGIGALNQARKGSQQLSIDAFKYDFINLGMKIIFFFTIAYGIQKLFEAIISAQGFVISFVAFFGLHLPANIPEPVRKFFLEGISIGNQRIQFWDIIKVVATLLVILEAMNYMNTQKALGFKPNGFTLAVFGVIITGLALITFPEIISRVQEIRAMNQTVAGTVNDPDFEGRDPFRAGR